LEVGVADKRYKDFDEASKEEAKEPIQVKLNGNIYTFPPALPARTVLAQMRWMDETGAMPTAAVPEWLSSIVGEEVMEDILDEGATWEQLEELLQYLLAEYQVVQENDAEVEVEPEEGDEDAPK
tara:strand:+ start:782 stop:1153 length:372 start_codon:yes stop_codon:yes gene_type:complete